MEKLIWHAEAEPQGRMGVYTPDWQQLIRCFVDRLNGCECLGNLHLG